MCCFCFNVTATTAIYTSLHPPALPDALPISRRRASSRRRSSCLRCAGCVRCRSSPSSTRSTARGCRRSRCRSEEHTSELQSLMRISYAVFCLQKKQRLSYEAGILHRKRDTQQEPSTLNIFESNSVAAH